MDGCWWFCHCDTGSRLLVNEDHHQSRDERAVTQWWVEYEGSDFTHRGTIGLSIHTAY